MPVSAGTTGSPAVGQLRQSSVDPCHRALLAEDFQGPRERQTDRAARDGDTNRGLSLAQLQAVLLASRKNGRLQRLRARPVGRLRLARAVVSTATGSPFMVFAHDASSSTGPLQNRKSTLAVISDRTATRVWACGAIVPQAA